MSNTRVRVFQFFSAVLLICVFIYFISLGGLTYLTLFDKCLFVLFFVIGTYLCIANIVYFSLYIICSEKVELTDYEVENREKYNKLGKYYLSRPYFVYNNNLIYGSWSIEFTPMTNDKPLLCRKNKDYLIFI